MGRSRIAWVDASSSQSLWGTLLLQWEAKCIFPRRATLSSQRAGRLAPDPHHSWIKHRFRTARPMARRPTASKPPQLGHQGTRQPAQRPESASNPATLQPARNLATQQPAPSNPTGAQQPTPSNRRLATRQPSNRSPSNSATGRNRCRPAGRRCRFCQRGCECSVRRLDDRSRALRVGDNLW